MGLSMLNIKMTPFLLVIDFIINKMEISKKEETHHFLTSKLYTTEKQLDIFFKKNKAGDVFH